MFMFFSLFDLGICVCILCVSTTVYECVCVVSMPISLCLCRISAEPAGDFECINSNSGLSDLHLVNQVEICHHAG